MIDNLRSQSAFQPEEEPAPQVPRPRRSQRSRRSIDQITGMSAGQRLIISILLLVMVCIMGFILMIVMGIIVPPFLF
jgi:hypothetical protein